jgi:hypothetical protein
MSLYASGTDILVTAIITKFCTYLIETHDSFGKKLNITCDFLSRNAKRFQLPVTTEKGDSFIAAPIPVAQST